MTSTVDDVQLMMGIIIPVDTNQHCLALQPDTSFVNYLSFRGWLDQSSYIDANWFTYCIVHDSQHCYLCVKKWYKKCWVYIDGLVQGRRNSIADALELRLSCTNPWTCKLWLYCLCCSGGKVTRVTVPYKFRNGPILHTQTMCSRTGRSVSARKK